MATTWAWIQHTGTQTGSPLGGTTVTDPVTACNWKNSGVVGDAYGSYPVSESTNSYSIYLAGKVTGTYNNILTGKFGHTSGAMPTNTTLKTQPAFTADGDNPYTTPSTTANAALTVDSTSTISISSGVAVWFGATSPQATGKAATQTGAATRYTTFMISQVQVGASPTPGDSASIVLSCQYLEN